MQILVLIFSLEGDATCFQRKFVFCSPEEAFLIEEGARQWNKFWWPHNKTSESKMGVKGSMASLEKLEQVTNIIYD